MSSSTSAQPCFRFSLAEIQSATKDFDEALVIGRGGFGKDNKEMILVYEYMPHGTLYDHIHKADTPLSWMQRLKIAIGAARGLDYLHTGVGTQHGVIHRDVKSSNILLDENWAAMISDFGLSKIGPTNQSGGLQVDRSLEEDQCSLVRWAQKCVKERKFDQLVDSSIAGTIASKCLRRFAQTAYSCLHSDPKERPTMTEVVASLQALQELQKKFDLSSESPSILGFPWKIHEYLFSTTNLQNSDQISTNEPKSHDKNMNQDEELVTRDVKIFTYSELKIATRDFGSDKFLGEGSYGKVYKGWVNQKTYFPNENSIGLPIAVNKLHRYNHFDPEMLKEFRHPNLVKLIGYCLKGEQLFLVYEFIPNGNFKDLLRTGGVSTTSYWLPGENGRSAIIARGMFPCNSTQLYKKRGKADPGWTYQVDESLLERHKILLDEEFTAKLSDYDVTKLVHGWYLSHNHHDPFNIMDYRVGYWPPLYLQSNLSGFKVVFAEILTGECISTSNDLGSESIMVRNLKEV
ncbi:serine/threonine/dual specificity protein kinase, catalytic domain-containing protein [Tanacetum coccineum]